MVCGWRWHSGAEVEMLGLRKGVSGSFFFRFFSFLFVAKRGFSFFEPGLGSRLGLVLVFYYAVSCWVVVGTERERERERGRERNG